MNILISNDDGIDSPGIRLLAEGLAHLGEVTVVAPHRERSTSGHSLTLHKPLRMAEVRPGFFAISGTPADCVYMATRKILKRKPDIVISGINKGANLGNDVYYSGTVAAAREAAVFGMKAVAISLTFILDQPGTPHLHWETAVDFTTKFVPVLHEKKLRTNTVININVPNLPKKEIKGVKFSKQGMRHYSDEITDRVDPRNKRYYWLGGQYKGFENIPGSDCVVVDQGFISITPLKIDSTDYELMEELDKWPIQFGG